MLSGSEDAAALSASTPPVGPAPRCGRPKLSPARLVPAGKACFHVHVGKLVDGGSSAGPALRPDWDAIRGDFKRRQTRVVRRELARVTGIDVNRLSEVLDGDNDDASVSALQAAFNACAAGEHDVLLAAYLYAVGLDEWEHSADWKRIRRLDRLVRRAKPPTPDPVVELFLHQLTSLGEAMAVENGLNCSCPTSVETRAAAVIASAEAAIECVTALGPNLTPAAAILHEMASAELAFFQGVKAAAAAVQTYIDGGPDAPAALNGVAVELALAENAPALTGDVYASELHAHRLTIESMAAGWPRLHVDRAKVVWCYPFAVNGPPPTEVLGVVSTQAARWTFAGLSPIDIGEVVLTDLWNGQLLADRRYRCLGVTLPGPSVQTTGHPVPITGYAMELRFSRLGNHYLRIERWEEDATLHDVHQAMRRATAHMGAEAVTCDSHEWEGIADLARAILDDLGRALAASFPVATTLISDTEVHVIVATRAVSIENADGQRSDASTEKALATTGATLFLHPVHQAATSLEEWIRYPRIDFRDLNLLAEPGFAGDVAVRTSNTTFLLTPGAPDWLALEYEEMAEFVASLPTLLDSWRRTIEVLVAQAADDMRADISDPEALRDVEERQLELRRTITDARMMLANLHSGALCLTSVQRRLLDRIYDAAHLSHVERDLQAQFDVAAEMYAQLASVRARIEEEQRELADQRVQSNRRVFELAIAVLSITGIAELAGLINSAFGISETGRRLEVYIIIGLVVIVGAVLGRQWWKERSAI